MLNSIVLIDNIINNNIRTIGLRSQILVKIFRKSVRLVEFK